MGTRARLEDGDVRFIFGDYVLDTGRRELTARGQAVAIGPKVFDLLHHLVANRDRVTGKDELLQAVWAGRIVSESTITSHINAVRKAIGDNGEAQRLVRTVARKGFRFVGEVSLEEADGAPEAPGGKALALPDRPSITVLPFQNLSGDPEQQYFTDGVVEDIILALSRVRWLFVIARNSSFTYRDRAVTVQDVGRELGVRYVLEGSVRRAADKVRITGQLIDAITGTHLWAERFEGTFNDLFSLQDRVAESVVGAIAPQLERAEMERAKRKPTESLDAYDYYLRGMANLHKGTLGAIDAALPLFYRAIELDPDFAAAHGGAAWCYFWRKLNGWMDEPQREIAEGTRLARLAVERGRHDAVALTRGGHALGHLAGDLDGGIALIERARLLNPNFALAWFLGGVLRVFRGELVSGTEDIAHALRLSPLDPEMFRMQAGMALASFFAGRYDRALAWTDKALVDLPSLLVAVALQAGSHALAGHAQEAAKAMERLRALDPTLTLSNLRDWMPLHRPEDFKRFSDALRLAGLPER